MKLSEKVYELLSQIPSGKVTTYKIIAEKLNTKAYRAVGQALKRNPNAPEVPCHRVVRSDGSLGGYNGQISGENIEKKILLLAKEGVKVETNLTVDLEEYLFKF